MRIGVFCLLLAAILTGAVVVARDGIGSKPSAAPLSLPQLIKAGDVTPQAADHASTPVDSLYLMGGPGELSGKFQDAAGLPDRQGWTGVDLHAAENSKWHVSTFGAAELDPATVDNHAWWCGEVLTSCSETDPPEGYGSNWYEILDWYGTVADPGSDVTVRIQAVLSYDVEPAEDFLYLKIDNTEYMETLATYTFQETAVVVDITTTVTPEYYVGTGGDQIHLRWSFNSDGGWDDEDCGWRTAGAAQIDLIQVHFDQGTGPVQVGWTETCEIGTPLQWVPTLVKGPGDFSKVWPQLDDDDPLRSNDTPQFAFIDDGVVVPGTGGSSCITHCYGPGGFIVNPGMGVADNYEFLHNEVRSPVVTVPPGGWNAAILSFDEYVHAPIYSGSPYIFGYWHIRSTVDPSGNSGWSDWRDFNQILWGDGNYIRNSFNVTQLLEPGFTHVQMALGVMNYYQYSGSLDGTPAPYYDNVSFVVYEKLEPSSLLVRADGSGDYPTIQSAINAAAVGDTILLDDGVYTGYGNRDLVYLGKAIVVASLNGNPENCILDAEGSAGNLHRGCSFVSEEGPDSILSGVTLRGGYYEGESSLAVYSGGALKFTEGSAPTISNCIFEDNTALGLNQYGGAVFVAYASPRFVDCIFRNNTGQRGGAIGAVGTSSPQISNCLFEANEAVILGGALYGHQSAVHFTVENCTFYGNVNTATNGTLYSYQNARFDVDRSIVAFGSAGYAAHATAATDFQFTCTDIYGFPVGDWYTAFADQLGSFGNLNADPLFCLAVNPSQPYGIDENSPCRPEFNPDCGLIGYYPVSCGVWSATDPAVGSAGGAGLSSCFPNPFNPSTTVSYRLQEAGKVTLTIFSLDGRRVRTLVDEVRPVGPQQVVWNGLDDRGRAVASGVLICRLQAGSVTESVRMVLLR